MLLLFWPVLNSFRIFIVNGAFVKASFDHKVSRLLLTVLRYGNKVNITLPIILTFTQNVLRSGKQNYR